MKFEHLNLLHGTGAFESRKNITVKMKKRKRQPIEKVTVLWYNEKKRKFKKEGSIRRMIKELMHDPIFLAGKSEVSTKEDLQVAQDLLDTLMAQRESCVGMAANMIGVKKRIIAFLDESGRAPTYTVMLNPEIVAKSGIYETEEGCLSLLGNPRKCKRYRTIKLKYQTLELKIHTKNFTGWTAQIIQHEVDHCNGRLI